MRLARVLAFYSIKHGLKERPLENVYLPFCDARIWKMIITLTKDTVFRNTLEGTVNEFSPAMLRYTLRILPTYALRTLPIRVQDIKGCLFLQHNYS